jgi:uncharacterized repeat protein (TIGR03803 family)
VVYKIDPTGHEAVLYSFTGGADGAAPYASVTCNSAGNVYGTTSGGGAAGAGVVYRVDGAGHEAVLYSFTGGADGDYPLAGVVQDSAGNLYGTAEFGGSAGSGVVFKLDRSGHETVLYSFTDCGYPNGLIRDSAGNLYGTTNCGGPAYAGTVFKLDKNGQEKVLYSFTGGADGAYPVAGLIMDAGGNLYGTTAYGGANGGGVVYKIDPTGYETVLYSFTGGADGLYPNAGVVQDSAGNLYGTTVYGGAAGRGTVYKLDPTDHETVLYNFTGKSDGAYPFAGVISDSVGNLYGATGSAGPAGAGALFKLDTTGHETVYGFPGSDGGFPWGAPIQDVAGNLYGTTVGGGAAGVGVVFKVDPTGHETVLYTFTGGADGANPYAGLIMDAGGNLYGTTVAGGSSGAGVVYKIDTTGHESVLYSFTGGADGANPYGVLAMDSAANFYGTTASGGAAGKGTAYKLDPMGHETVLYSFTGGADGGVPYSGVTRDSAGNLYGTTWTGGAGSCYGGCGVVYKVDPAGHQTVLSSFLGVANGGFSYGGLALDTAGNLYGTTWSGGPASGEYPGMVFKVNPAGNLTEVYAFTGFADGGGSRATPIFDPAGNLYGTTEYGGEGPCFFFGCGVVFEVDPSGHQTVLYTFTGGSDGSEPQSGVIRDATGNLYGTTSGGGSAGFGAVYKVTPGAASLAAPPTPPFIGKAGHGFRPPLPGEPPQKRPRL